MEPKRTHAFQTLSRYADPTKAIPKDKAPEYYQNQPDTPFKLATKFTVTPKSLPRLKFGIRYRFRARAVDLAGNSLKSEDEFVKTFSPVFALPLDPVGFPYLRFEPVGAPLVDSKKLTSNIGTHLAIPHSTVGSALDRRSQFPHIQRRHNQVQKRSRHHSRRPTHSTTPNKRGNGGKTRNVRLPTRQNQSRPINLATHRKTRSRRIRQNPSSQIKGHTPNNGDEYPVEPGQKIYASSALPARPTLPAEQPSAIYPAHPNAHNRQSSTKNRITRQNTLQPADRSESPSGMSNLNMTLMEPTTGQKTVGSASTRLNPRRTSKTLALNGIPQNESSPCISPKARPKSSLFPAT